MYEQHFGLKKPPFRLVATGADVFLGPQTAETIKSIRKALAIQDAAVTVSGPVGVGKTAIVGRSLDALGGKQTRIRIGRMSIAHDEILDYLLEVMGVEQPPASTIRRIALFRALLAQKIQDGERVIVIVEDGARLGEDPLAELEALTAADGGAGGGAAIVIMGDPGLRTAMDKPSLDRLNQRIRLRHRLKPLGEGELTGYLKHCFRLSGGDFDAIFAPGTAPALCQLSGGIPRVCNNLVQSTLMAAAEQSVDKVDLDFLGHVAEDQYGLTVNSTSADVSQVAEALKPPTADPDGDQRSNIQISQTQSVPALSDEDVPVAVDDDTAPETAPDEVSPPADAGSTDAVSANDGRDAARPAAADEMAEPVAEPEPEPEAEFEIPELIQDTMPGLEALPDSNTDATGMSANIPTLQVSEDAASNPQATEAPVDVPLDVQVDADRPAAGRETPAGPAVDAPLDAPVDLPLDVQADADHPAAGNRAPAAPAGEAPVDTPLDLPLDVQADTDRPAARSKDAPAAPEDDDSVQVAASAPQPSQADAPPAPTPDPEPVEAAEDGDSVPDDETPAWDREPTLAELRPDIEALESALAEFSGDAEEPETPAAEEPEVEVDLMDRTFSSLPELKLEESIQQSIDEAQAALNKHDSTIAEGIAADELAKAAPADEKADPELEKIARGLARAKTLDDVDDKMAETLFGEEFSLVAAQVAANCADIDAADDEEATAAPEPESRPNPAPAGASAGGGAPQNAAAAAPKPGPSPADRPAKPAPAAKSRRVVDSSPSQRLRTLQALNSGQAEGGPPSVAGMAKQKPAAPTPTGNEKTPPTIENQFAENIAPANKPKPAELAAVTGNDDDDDDGKKKGGFFSRFKKS